MTPDRFEKIISRYSSLTLTLAGDFCLDRYLEIDPSIQEISIETGLPVHNVTRVRSQPGGAGTILNNLQALGIGRVIPIGFAGLDGEGYELTHALNQVPCLDMSLDSFICTEARRTFTYCKPLVCGTGVPPRELSRLDFKNFSATPPDLVNQLIDGMRRSLPVSDAVIVLDQVDIPGTGVIHPALLDEIRNHLKKGSIRLSLGDSRQRIREFHELGIKVNREEFAAWHSIPHPQPGEDSSDFWLDQLRNLAGDSSQPVFVSLSELGIIGQWAGSGPAMCPAHPVSGELDIVGAGDCTTANLICALAAGANAGEAMEIAMAAASVVIHKLGTTGTASPEEIARKLFP